MVLIAKEIYTYEPPTSVRYKIPEAVRVFDQNLFYIEPETGKQSYESSIKKAVDVTGLTLVYVTPENL